MGQRLMSRVGVVGLSVAAVVAGCLAGAVAPAGAAAPSSGAVASEDQARASGVEAVGPIAVSPASPGDAFPSGPAEVAVMPDGGVASGVSPGAPTSPSLPEPTPTPGS